MKKIFGIAVAVVVALIVSSYGCYRYAYPYGWDHRCDKQLYLTLQNYAEKYDGAFPSGEATPEASLSLIQTLEDIHDFGYLLRRRDVPVERVSEILKRGELLGPDTCGWNYVEGLHRDSNPELALFWDKEGLSEIGMRLGGGGHNVTFVSCQCLHIPESEWNDFMENQKRLFAEEKAMRKKD
jgi:hypothetical protein